MVLSTKVIINYLSFAVGGVLAIPTFLIMISWNSLPGSGLYPVKRGLEKVALVLVTPSMEVTAQLRAKLIDRRFGEANTLLVQSSQTQGFNEFDGEVQSAKDDILKKARDENSDERVVEQQINDLLAQLEKYNLELETQKQTYIAYNPQFVPQPTTTTIVIPGKNANQPSKTITYTQQPQTSSVSPTIVINQVNQSQNNLNSSIDALHQEQERLQQQILTQQLKLQREQEERIREQQGQASQPPAPAAPSQQPSQQPSQEPSHEPEGQETPPPQPSQPDIQAVPPSSQPPEPEPPASQAPAQSQEQNTEPNP